MFYEVEKAVDGILEAPKIYGNASISIMIINLDILENAGRMI